MRAESMLRVVAAVSVIAAVAASQSAGQRSALREVREWGMAGGSFAVAVPVGEFADHVGAGAGFDGFLAFNVDRAGLTAIRVDGSLLAYGRASGFAYLESPYYLPIDVTTASYIVSLGAGPQITFGQGPVKLYGFGLGGFSYFTTTTSFESYDCGCASFDEITEHDDLTLAWEAGGGMLVQLGRRRHVMLDLGARYLSNGRAQYLPARFVGNASTVPLETEANLVAIHVGVTVGLR